MSGILISEHDPERQGSWGDHNRNKGSGTRHFSLPFPSHRTTCGNQHSANICDLTCLHQVLRHRASVDLPFTVMFTSVLVLWTLWPEDQHKSHQCIIFETTTHTFFRDLSSSGGSGSSGRSHFTSRAAYTLLTGVPLLLGTKHCPQQAKRDSNRQVD